jgi:hypothetical protein
MLKRVLVCVLIVQFPSLALTAQVPETLVQSGFWKYELVAVRGTPQKFVGRLWYKNKEVIGQEDDDRINAEMGQFMWRPQQCDRSECGWYRINSKKKYPRWQKVVIDESEKEKAWHPVPCKPNCANW